MEEEYDVIVCGTGLKECILSGLLSVNGKKVLHLDRNNYYGGDSASLNLTNLWGKFRPGETAPQSYGSNRDWNVDLIPKMVMACGKLVKILLHTKVTRYLEWKSVDATYVYQYQKANMFMNAKYIHKVPSNDIEALKSPLMGLLEKNRCKNFFQFIASWDDDKPSTKQGVDPNQTTMRQVYEKFGLHRNTIEFVGHTLALYRDDAYIDQPCGPTIEKIKLYMYSISRYGNSPFIYPVYGLGGLPEGFSRLSAIHGGTYMLNKPVDGFEYDAQGKVCGVRSGDEVARAKMVICDPSYVYGTQKIRVAGRVVRSICFLNAPIPNTDNATSCQIIIPQSQLQRRSDVYVTMISSSHRIASEGKYIAIVSATVETPNPAEEIRAALDLLGPIDNQFTYVSDLYEPTDNGCGDNVFVTESYDATSHFETASTDVLRIWKNITGEELNLDISAEPEDLSEM